MWLTTSDANRCGEQHDQHLRSVSSVVGFIQNLALPRSTFNSQWSGRAPRCAPFPRYRLRRVAVPHHEASAQRLQLSLSESSSGSHGRAVLSIDVGTSAIKAAVCFIDQRGKLGPVARVAHETHSPGNLQITQSLDDWFQGAIAACREALAGVGDEVHISAIAVTGQMQDLIAVGPKPPSLLRSSAILYSDARAHLAAAALSERSGTRVDATSILAKLTLLPAADVGEYSLLLGAADYIVHAFSATPKPIVTDATTVSTTGLTRAPHRCYDEALLAACGLSRFAARLPAILPAPRAVGRLCAEVAGRLGRPMLAGTPLVHGGGDAFSAAAGAERVGTGCGAYVYCGSSGWTGLSVSAGGLDDGEAEGGSGVFGLGHAGDADATMRVASVANAGAAVAWAGGALLGGCDAEGVAGLADGGKIGAGGVCFVPYLAGRRCPRPSAGAGGALLGLRDGAGREEVGRAVVEGVAFALAEAAGELGDGVGGRVRMVGGGARCGTLVRGVAALLGGGVEVARRGDGEDAAVGVLGAARAAAGVLGGEVGEWWRDGEVVVVGEEERGEWERAFERWRAAVDAIDGVGGMFIGG